MKKALRLSTVVIAHDPDSTIHGALYGCSHPCFKVLALRVHFLWGKKFKSRNWGVGKISKKLNFIYQCSPRVYKVRCKIKVQASPTFESVSVNPVLFWLAFLTQFTAC